MAAPLTSLQGYDALAELLGRHPGLSIFHLFRDLNVGNLLDLQAELVHLKERLEVAAYHNEEVFKCSEEDHHAVTVQHLKGVDGKCCPYHRQIWHIKLEIRKALAEYSEAHLHYEHLTTHCKPGKPDLKALRHWLKHKNGGNNFLQGVENYTWDKETEDDLASFSPQSKEKDFLSRLLAGPVGQWLHSKLSRLPARSENNNSPHSLAESQLTTSPLHFVPDNYISYPVTAAVTVIASLLPTLPVFILYYIQEQVARMGAIVGMTFVFSTLVTVFTKATWAEVFAVATAFTAVQVVWVENGNGSVNNCGCNFA